MDTNRYSWILADVHGYSWIPIDIHGINGYSWIQMDTNRYSWILIHGYFMITNSNQKLYPWAVLAEAKG